LDLELQNRWLLSKWLFSLVNGNGAWQQLMRNKYWGGGGGITQLNKKPGDSQFWTSLMNAKDQFLSFESFRLQNCKIIRFWEDMGNNTLKNSIPTYITLLEGRMLQ
jgi:hypothetical protein